MYNNNYRLGKNSNHIITENKNILFRHRSLGQLLVFEEQAKEIINNASIMFNNYN